MAVSKVSFWRRIQAAISPKAAARRGIRIGVAPLSTDGLLPIYPPIDFGIDVNNDSALRITAFYAGIRLIADNIASLPKSVKRSTSNGLVDYSEHPAWKAISETPNEYTNAFSFWKTMATWLNGWGNAYAYIREMPDGSIELHQVHPACVQVALIDGKKWFKVYACDTDRPFLDGVHPARKMLHFMLLTLDGVEGVNPVVYNAIALGKSLAQEKFGADFYSKGGNVRAVMETDGHLGDDEYERWMKHFKAASGNFETPLLEYGIKYKQLTIDPEAASLLDSENMSLQDICRILNIPPHMLADLSHATFSNIEHQTIQFVQYTLRPIAKMIEVELRTKLFDSRERVDVEFSMNGLLRGDTAARSAFYHNAILDGYMSRNEVRDLEGFEHREGLDDMLYPLNTGIVKDDGTLINPNANTNKDEKDF